MKRSKALYLWMVVFFLAVMFGGCGGRHLTVGQGVLAAQHALGGAGLALSVATDTYSAALEAKIAECRALNLPTEDQRVACLGGFSDYETAVREFERLKQLYDEAADLLSEAKKVADQLDVRMGK